MPTSDWLTLIIRDAPTNGHCTRMGCTTCGAGPFLQSVRNAAVDELARETPLRMRAARFTEEQIIRTIVAGLRQLPEDLVDTDAAQLLLREYFNPQGSHGVNISTHEELAGTPAGHARLNWLLWQVASNSDRAERERQRAKAEKERKRLKLEATRIESARRAAEKIERDAARTALLAELKALAPIERLRLLTSDSAIDLNRIPVDLVPVEVQSVRPELVEALLARIGRRRGAWLRVARVLRDSIRAE